MSRREDWSVKCASSCVRCRGEADWYLAIERQDVLDSGIA